MAARTVLFDDVRHSLADIPWQRSSWIAETQMQGEAALERWKTLLGQELVAVQQSAQCSSSGASLSAAPG